MRLDIEVNSLERGAIYDENTYEGNDRELVLLVVGKFAYLIPILECERK